MNNYRIIDPRHDLPDILLRINSGEDGIEVVIEAIGFSEDEKLDDYFFESKVKLPTIDDARRFIRDYSEKSACEWCEENGVLYENPNPDQK